MAQVGWQPSYRNWTTLRADQAVNESRKCDNISSDPTVSGYRPIDHVTVSVEDSTGQIQGIELDVGCDRGMSGSLVDIRGLVPELYLLKIEAKTDDNVVLYRYEDDAFDLNTFQSLIADLKAATGETRFTPHYANVIFPNCPPDVASVRYTLFEIKNGITETTPTLTRTTPACVQGTSADVTAREIPVRPLPGPNHNYINNTYLWVVEGLAANGTTLYCNNTNTRTIAPGNDNFRDDVALIQGVCP